MTEFMRLGGPGMFPTLIFGFLLVAASVLALLRPERRYAPLLWSLGLTTLCSALLGFCTGVLRTFRYLDQVPREEQLAVAALGIQESLHNVVLALVLLGVAALLGSASAWRTLRSLPAQAR